MERREGLELHYYQGKAVDDCEEAWKTHRKLLTVLPTGAGKTVFAGEIIAREIEAGGVVLMLAHTTKLVCQFRDSCLFNYGIQGGVVVSQVNHANERLICATVQSVASRMKKGRWEAPEPTLIVIDESHRSLSGSHQMVVNAYPKAKVLGLTATPRRGDRKDLMKFFDYKVADIPLSQLIDEGYLAPLEIENFPVEINVKRLPNRGKGDIDSDEDVEGGQRGDFSAEEVNHAIEPYLESIADEFIKFARGRCSLVFLPLRTTSRKFSKMLIERGLKSRHVCGEMSKAEVDEIIAELERGDIDCICNSMLLTEGVDIRPVNLIMNLRLTTSWPLYVQIAGRGTRTFDPTIKSHNRHGADCRWPLKTSCLLLDPLWLCDDHSLLQRPSTLVASDDEERDAMDRIIKELAEKKKKKAEKEAEQDDGDIDADGEEDDEEDDFTSLMEVLKMAIHEREENLRKRLERNKTKTRRKVNAMEFFLNIKCVDLAQYEPEAAWEMEPMTAGQREVLKKNKFDLSTIKTKGHASAIITKLMERQRAGLSSVPQAHYASKEFGMADAFNRSFKDVSDFIDKKKSGKDPLKGIPI